MENVKIHSSVSTLQSCGPINKHVKLPETYSDADHTVNWTSKRLWWRGSHSEHDELL